MPWRGLVHQEFPSCPETRLYLELVLDRLHVLVPVVNSCFVSS